METTKKDTSLIGCMMDVPNPRALYNQRHKFIAIITIAIMAVICGMDTWNEIEDWARSKKSGWALFSNFLARFLLMIRLIVCSRCSIRSSSTGRSFRGQVLLRAKYRELLRLTKKLCVEAVRKPVACGRSMW